jgi:hypothetical protein
MEAAWTDLKIDSSLSFGRRHFTSFPAKDKELSRKLWIEKRTEFHMNDKIETIDFSGRVRDMRIAMIRLFQNLLMEKIK